MTKFLKIVAVLICACTAVSCSTPSGAGSSHLELQAFANGDKPEHLVVNITNHGRKQVTLLTKGYSFGSLGTNDRRLPYFHIIFDIWKMEWPDTEGKKQRQTTVPSLPDLSPVTLRQGETAQVTFGLDEAYQKSLAQLDAEATLIYEIREGIAERFGLWQGKLEVKMTVAELRQKTANQKLQPTVKTPVESGDEQGTAAEL